MRPHLVALLLLATVAGMAPAHASARSSAAAVRVIECRQAPDRQATFRASARRVEGARTMWIRLRLQERTPRADWRTVAAPGLGAWRKSRAGVGRFAFRQRVLALKEGNAYRVVAGIRWYDASGRVLARARRVSRPCRQPGNLPNLRVRRVIVSAIAGRPGVAAYRIDVRNRGTASAPASSVRLTVDDDIVDSVAVPPLAPGEIRGVQVRGPPCAFALVASADPAGLVAEADERDNSLSVPCGQF